MNRINLMVPFKADGVDLLANAYVVGFPSMTGVAGGMHQIERKIKEIAPGLINKFECFSLVLDKCELKEGHPRIINYMKAKRSSGVTPPTTLDKKTGAVSGYLLATIDCKDDVNVTTLIEVADRAIQNVRFCGGMIFTKGGFSAYHELKDALAAMKSTSPLFVVEDMSELLTDKKERVDLMLKLLSRPKNIEKTAFIFKDENYGYLSPTSIGYVLLEEPNKKACVRNDFLHAYAEPQIGLVRLRTIGSTLLALRAAENDPDFLAPAILWNYEKITTENQTQLIVRSI